MVMFDLLLTGGESSRFQQQLVKGKKSVIQYEANLGWPFAGPSDYKDPGVYAMMLLYNPAFQGEQIVQQAQEEMARIQEDGVGADELARARTYLRASRVRQLQSSHRRAQYLGKYELLDGRPEYINTELEEFLAVTPEEIRAAARKYIDPGKRTVLHIVPDNGGEERK
jgi:zinc protease